MSEELDLSKQYLLMKRNMHGSPRYRKRTTKLDYENGFAHLALYSANINVVLIYKDENTAFESCRDDEVLAKLTDVLSGKFYDAKY